MALEIADVATAFMPYLLEVPVSETGGWNNSDSCFGGNQSQWRTVPCYLSTFGCILTEVDWQRSLGSFQALGGRAMAALC